jgi:FkbM family methyltransferase
MTSRCVPRINSTTPHSIVYGIEPTARKGINISLLNQIGKKLLPEAFKRGIKVAFGVPDTGACLAHLKRCGFSPNAAIDVGAYSGEWTSTLRRLFPRTRVLMIEPQEVKTEELQMLCSCNSGLDLATVLLGPEVGERVGFYESDTASSVLQDANHVCGPSKFLPMTTLDLLTAEKKFPPPDLIKLDVQGYEMEVLEGASQTLKSAQVVLMEVNLIPIYKDAPLVHETVRYMSDKDFRVYDVGTFFRRPFDNALWQMDIVFVRSSSPLIASNRWS